MVSVVYVQIRPTDLFFSEVEDELEDASANPFNTQPPGLDQLVQLTGFNRKWIMFMYRNFKQVKQDWNMIHLIGNIVLILFSVGIFLLSVTIADFPALKVQGEGAWAK